MSIKICIATVALAFFGFAHSCQIEEMEGFENSLYQKLVCEAQNLERMGDLDGAIEKYKEAAEIDLFETPNFTLFPLVAINYWKTGKKEEALYYLKISEMSLEIFLGILECRWNGFDVSGDDSPKQLVKKGEIGLYKDGKLIKTDLSEKVFFIMCQENQIDYFVKNAGINFILDSSVEYQEARKLINKAE